MNDFLAHELQKSGSINVVNRTLNTDQGVHEKYETLSNIHKYHAIAQRSQMSTLQKGNSISPKSGGSD